MRRIGLFGGSFNPVHMAHLILAEQTREEADLHSVWFIPAREPPHKPDQPLACPEHRLRMLRRATGDNPAFRVDDIELRREGPSYTLRTVQEVRERLSEPQDTELCLLLGGDSLVDLPNWWKARKLVQEVSIIVMRRPGHRLPDIRELGGAFGPERARKILDSVVQTPLLEISATRIRRRIEAGASVRYMLPEPVRDYIEKNEVYPPG